MHILYMTYKHLLQKYVQYYKAYAQIPVLNTKKKTEKISFRDQKVCGHLKKHQCVRYMTYTSLHICI